MCTVWLPKPGVEDRLLSLETAVLVMARPRPPSQEPVHQGKSSGEAGRKWNASGCSFPRCRHLHVWWWQSSQPMWHPGDWRVPSSKRSGELPLQVDQTKDLAYVSVYTCMCLDNDDRICIRKGGGGNKGE